MIKALQKRLEFMNMNLRILTIRQTLGMFFRRMVLPYTSLFILAVGGDSAQIGIINSLRPLAGLVIFPISGYLTDRTGRVKLIALAGYLTALTMMVYVFAPSWHWIALGALLQGFMVFQFPPSSAILADSMEPRSRGTGIATMNTLANASAMFSPYIAGFILEIYGYNFGMRILYAALAISEAVNATLVVRYLKETAEVKKTDTKIDLVKALKEAYSGILALMGGLPTSIKALAVVVGMGFITNGVASAFWVVYASEIIGLSSVEWGLILLVESVFKTALTIPSGIIADRYSRTKALFAAILFSLLSTPAMIFARSFNQVLLVRLGVGLAGALFMPSSTALIGNCSSISFRVICFTNVPLLGSMTTRPILLSSLKASLIGERDTPNCS